MNEFSLNVEERSTDSDEPRVDITLKRNGEEILRRDARIFSEDDIIVTSNAMRDAGDLSLTDVEQGMAELIEPIRTKWLRGREQHQPEDKTAEGTQEASPRYLAVLPEAHGDQPRAVGVWDVVKNVLLANFIVTIDEDVEVQDDIDSRREFVGKVVTASGTSSFRITAVDFADNSKLKGALFAAGGCGLVIHCTMDELRRAISVLSLQQGNVRTRKTTTNFGWTKDRSAYQTPSLRISANKIEQLDHHAEVRVDLGAETPACHLDMKRLDGPELLCVKQHIVNDLLTLSDRSVTHTLLGATAASVLYPFTKGAGRFALWLVGRTGAGKSFVAKLFANFFGDFPVSSAPFTTWSATPNYVQRQGYFFKDAMYLVDDYKPEVVVPYQVVRVLQTYADNTARGRLTSNATANVLRPIRGLLVCTGEDVPEHNASAIGRSIIIRVPQQAKHVVAGAQCLAKCEHYSGVMADFIRWLLADNRLTSFQPRFGELQQKYYADVAGQQNDIRIATNLALLGASFELFAQYLGDVWDGWCEVATNFVNKDLIVIRDEMLGAAKEQQASEVFLATLAELIRFNHVRIDGFMAHHRDGEHKPLIGRSAEIRPNAARLARGDDEQSGRFEISTQLALAEVNASLRQQSRAELRITERALLEQLREDGKLLDPNGGKLADDADPTRRVRIDGRRQMRTFTIRRSDLLGD